MPKNDLRPRTEPAAPDPRPIHVTKTELPELSVYTEYLRVIFETCQLTNQGRFAQALENRLKEWLDAPFLSLCANGTTALQLAVRAAGLAGKKVITTPFSYVATIGSLLWENCTPVFADIDEDSLCINPEAVEAVVDPDCAGLLPVHIYGNVCDVEALADIAARHRLVTVYDAAHAFGSRYLGKSALTFGDYSICSFHATKMFHTAEGGCLISHDEEARRRIHLMRAFGHVGDAHLSVGTNAKMSELHAAMGLCMLDMVGDIMAKKKERSQLYDRLLPSPALKRPTPRPGLEYNYMYHPLVFESEASLLRVLRSLEQARVFPRRYFHPALNTLPYLKERQRCPVAESIAPRVLCLPLYPGLALSDVERIAGIINATL